MRTLILTSKIGGGHNSCAQAIREVMTKNGAYCTEREALALILRRLPRKVSALHTGVYRSVPALFRVWYRHMEHPTVFVCKSQWVRRFFRKGAERLYAITIEGRYDVIICTHVIPALIVTEMLERHSLPVRTYFVSTDYTCSPGTRESGLDCYFIPDASLVQEFTACGIPAEKLAVGGIPVCQAFYRHTDRSAAKRALHVSPECRHLVVMGGSMGCGPMEQLAGIFAQTLSPSQEATFVCGTNRRLYETLCQRYAGCERLHISGYTDNVSLLLDSADLYLTKPGGLSVTEAAAKSLPMVLLNVVAGCENYNLAYYTGLGAAVTADTVGEVAQLCSHLLEDGDQLEKMAAAFRKSPQPNSAQRIYDRVLSDQRGTAPSAEAAGI